MTDQEAVDKIMSDPSDKNYPTDKKAGLKHLNLEHSSWEDLIELGMDLCKGNSVYERKENIIRYLNRKHPDEL